MDVEIIKKENEIVPLWTFKDVIFAILIFLVVVFTVGIFIYMFVDVNSGGISEFNKAVFLGILVIIQSGSLFSLSWYFGVKKYKNKLSDLGLREFKIFRGIGYSLIILPALFAFEIFYSFFVTHLFQARMPEVNYVDLFGGETLGIVLTVLLVVIVAPVAEEVFFRGFLYPAFKKRFGKWLGVLISALIFGLFHINIWLIIPISLIGLINILLYERTKSLDSCIILHSMNNLMAVLVLFWEVLWH